MSSTTTDLDTIRRQLIAQGAFGNDAEVDEEADPLVLTQEEQELWRYIDAANRDDEAEYLALCDEPGYHESLYPWQW